MSTKKPRIQALVKENTYIEFKEICEKENRSESNMAAIAIEEFIKRYKKENDITSQKNINIDTNSGTINM